MVQAAHSPESFVSRRIVLDTQGPLIFIGRLEQQDAHGFWLADADVHDRSDGHSTKEMYLSDACALERAGTPRVNRRRVFVQRVAVVSVSLLDDILTGDEVPEGGELPEGGEAPAGGDRW